MSSHTSSCLFFFFNDTATTEIYTLSLHDALPISPGAMMILGNSPWAAWSANRKSACSVLVGSPVAGPALCHRIITGPGASVIPAHPSPSAISENPGPEVEVDERRPA